MAKRKSRKKKRSHLKGWLIVTGLVIVFSFLAYLWYNSVSMETTSFARYAEFGIELPENYKIHGIDVSWYQGSIDWKAVKKMRVRNVQVGFAFIKATEGSDKIDKQFKRNWNNAGKVGIIKGAYHFFLASKSGKTQALNFIKNVQLKPGDLPPVLDIENLYGTKPEVMRKEAMTWLTMVEAHFKVKPIIYTYVNFYATFMSSGFKTYPLWAAHYHEKNKPGIDRSWVFWQHSENGRVNGIITRVDFNVFNGDSSNFAKFRVMETTDHD